MEGLPPSAASPRAVEVDIGRRTIPGLNQENLKRVISLPQAIGIAFHQTVGGGVMALTGVAIAMTGGGTPLAYLLAALSTVIVTVPFVVLGSAMPVAGGSYTYSARLFHPFLGYFNTAFAVMAQTGLGIFGFAAGQYMHSLDPFFDPKIVAVSLISAFYVANMFGAVISARLGIYTCCAQSERLMTKFVGAGSEWSYYPDPNCTRAGCALLPIPNDVVHDEPIKALDPADDDLPEFKAMRREGVIFIWNHKPTCFWPPEGGI